jgi:hypothetical protein
LKGYKATVVEKPNKQKGSYVESEVFIMSYKMQIQGLPQILKTRTHVWQISVELRLLVDVITFVWLMILL